MHYSEKTRRAANMVDSVFLGKVGRDGFPLAIHSYEVGGYFCSERRCLLGLLHDVVEEDSRRYAEIKELFGDDIAKGVGILSRYEDEQYFDYIRRVRDSGDVDAIEVKRVDLQNNMREDRMKLMAKFGGGNSLSERYNKALKILAGNEE